MSFVVSADFETFCRKKYRAALQIRKRAFLKELNISRHPISTSTWNRFDEAVECEIKTIIHSMKSEDKDVAALFAKKLRELAVTIFQKRYKKP